MAKTLLPLLSLYSCLDRVVKERELSDWEKGSNYAGEGERGEEAMDEGTLKTPTPLCRFHWSFCLGW